MEKFSVNDINESQSKSFEKSSNSLDTLATALGSNLGFVFEKSSDSSTNGVLIRAPNGTPILYSNDSGGHVVYTNTSREMVLKATFEDKKYSVHSENILLGTIQIKFGMAASADVKIWDEMGQPIVRLVVGKGAGTEGAQHFLMDVATGNELARANYYISKKSVKISMKPNVPTQSQGLILITGHIFYKNYFGGGIATSSSEKTCAVM